jgi:two-component system, NarL family, sensor histidine kinase DesK
MNTQAPDWARRGPRPWTLLIWLPICFSLLIAPVLDPVSGSHPVAAGLTVTAAVLTFTAAVLTRFRSGARVRQLAVTLLTGLAVLAVVTTSAYSLAWSSLFVLLAIGVGSVLVNRYTPVLIAAVTVLAAGTLLLAGDSADAALSTGLTVLLTGLGTYAFNQLFAVVGELRCTRQELATLAVTAERERFGRDLHDLLGHTLSVIVVKAEAVRRLAPLDSAAAAGHAADIETIGREALADIRRAASGYRGAGLDRELDRARAALDAAGVELALSQRLPAGDGPLPEGTDVLLGWVVREGVTNVVRHARATRCAIDVERTDRGVRLTIDDDGREQDHGPGTGVGLLGLTERVAAAGGRLDAAPTGEGFRLIADLPEPADRAGRQPETPAEVPSR